MKHNYTNHVYFALILFTLSTKVVLADRMIRYIFNSGQEPTSSTFCTSADELLIDAIFGQGAIINRRLDDTERILPSAQACKDNCKGFTPGTCRATGCAGHRLRRGLMNTTTDIAADELDRDLQTTSTCTSQMDSMTKKLDDLITFNKVTSTCKAYLDKRKRTTSCYDDVVYGSVLGVKVWDAGVKPAKVLHDNLSSDGFSFCSWTKFTMTSINHPCVDYVHFRLFGPNNYYYETTEGYEPYSLFLDDESTSPPTLQGQLLKPGSYTLMMFPDSQNEKVKTIKFNIRQC